MKWSSKSFAGAVLLAGVVLCCPACKKKAAQAMASDLHDAGYQLTAEDWFRACETNDVEAMKKFLAAGFSDKTKDAEGNVGLHHAAQGGAEKSAEFLLNRRLPIDELNHDKRTPLMLAVIAKQASMVNYLLRQGASPQLKDKDNYSPLMLAVKESSANCVSSLAPYSRDELDSALLLSAMEGKPEVIDSLTNYGASVYTRMEDGRTPLMIAAENGQLEAVKLLTELGSSRFTTDSEGRTAATLATAAGFPEVATYLLKEPSAAELSLESDDQVATKMEALVEAAAQDGEVEAGGTRYHETSHPAVAAGSSASSAPVASSHGGSIVATKGRPLARPMSLQGETLSASVPREGQPQSEAAGGTAATFSSPPLVMRHYREREVPVEIRTVEGDTAVVRIPGARSREVRVKEGQHIPGSNLLVVKVKRRMESSKLNFGLPTEVSVVQVRDTANGATREWIAGVTSQAHDPVALVEDAATGKRYVASTGQHFKGADGREFVVSDVRPNQLVIEETSSGQTQTIPLKGPRG